jgi:uncharacterized protein (TIGR02453 family)
MLTDEIPRRMVVAHFTRELFDFLFDLDVNNSRAWMDANRDRYEQHVKQPLYAFCDDLAGPLHDRVSPHLVSVGRIQGGSVFQIHRDTRFSDDKTPYKRNAGAQFRHELGSGDVHAPGMYLHLEPGNCFMGGGLYRPPVKALTPIRERMVESPDEWRTARDAVLAAGFGLGGEQLKTSPRGFDTDHELIEDLRRTSIVVSRPFEESDALAEDFLDTFVGWCAQAAPVLRFACDAHGLPF